MSKLLNNTASLQNVLDALQNKAAGGGGTDTSDATATANDILSGKTAYTKDGKVTGTIETKTASNLSASGATVTVPAGYYATQATKSVASGSAKTPATTITKNPTITVNASGLITASVSGTQNVTPTVSAGYVSSGTAGTITVSGSNTKQLTVQAAKTITPSESSQTAVASGVYTTGAVTVAAIPSTYVKPTATKGETTYTPNTSDQTIASGTYLTGAQTIKGDSNLVASNIKSGVSIFGVSGNYEGSGGTPTPTQEKIVDITENGTVEVLPDDGHALSKVTVNVSVAGGSGGSDSSVNAFLEGTLEEVNCSGITTVQQYTFYDNPGLKRVRLANAITINNNNFRACDALESIDLPSATGTLGTYVGQDCDRLTTVNIPNATGLGQYNFQSADILAKIDLPNVASIGNYSFRYGVGLQALILRKSDGIVTNGGTGVLAGSGIAKKTGYIYVPAALIDTYKTATNWSTYAAQFRAIEDYPEITGG